MEKNDAYQIAVLEDKIIETVSNYVKKIPRPFGLLLSGGFDSGLLAALTRPDFIFTVQFPWYGPKYDESRFTEAIISHLKLSSKVHIFTPEPQYFNEELKEAVKIIGKPTTHFSLVPFHAMMKLVSERMKGLGVVPHVLSGEGPDEYLGGYARYIIFNELDKLKYIPELRSYQPMVDKVVGKDLVQKYSEFMGYPTYTVLSKNPLLGVIGEMDMKYGGIEEMEQALAKKQQVFLHYPYINDDFAKYCYALPDNLKVRDGVTKWAFRQVCKKYLPEFMWDRAKMGGPVAPVNVWLGKADKGEFNKEAYLKLQEDLLNDKK